MPQVEAPPPAQHKQKCGSAQTWLPLPLPDSTPMPCENLPSNQSNSTFTKSSLQVKQNGPVQS